ncbi:MAG: uracil-DNA glycosylase [Deltaproteobacteria bacterium]|nr:uracil-DNA glycosylase [Deltaproteobacteria bacterium]
MSDALRQELCGMLRDTRNLLRDLQQLGVDGLALPASHGRPGAAPERSDRGGTAARETLEQIRADLGDCRRCPLSKTRQQIVFGAGTPQARLVFVGEAPGREEDLQGLPFVGEAGQLLDRILFAMGLSREEVYICNVGKCRPPGNREPQPEEVAACEPFLKRQLAAIRPRLLVALGRCAAQTLLRDRTPIGRLRGQWREYEGIPLMPTYHPAYLLRNPNGKREVWEDMKKVLRRLREEEPE